MKSPLIPLSLLLICACLSGCLSVEEIKLRHAARAEAAQLNALESANTTKHETFRKSKSWKKKVFRDQAVLALAKPDNLHLKVVIADQRGFAFVKNLIGYDFPLATGRKSHPTPVGEFKIIAKERVHHSNRYGKIVDASGNVTVENADADKNKPAEGESFRGAPMPYFMRLTNDGVGLHIGYVPGYPASHGCIRIPANVAPPLYEMAAIGTPVTIIQTDDIPASETKTLPQKALKPAAKTSPASRKPGMS